MDYFKTTESRRERQTLSGLQARNLFLALFPGLIQSGLNTGLATSSGILATSAGIRLITKVVVQYLCHVQSERACGHTANTAFDREYF
jgi:hypothetical protein